MLSIITCLFGIFVGLTTSWYFQIKPMTQLKNENNDLRTELEDLKFDLSVANKEIELQDKQIECIRTVLEQNNYGRDDIKIAKLKELVADLEDNN